MIWRSEVTIGQVLEELLAAALGQRLEVLVQDELGEVGQAGLTLQDALPELSLPAGVALTDDGLELAVVDHLLRGEQAAGERIEATDVGVEEVLGVDAGTPDLGVEVH